MSAPNDLVLARIRLGYIIETPLAPMSPSDAADLRAVHALLVSLEQRCASPDADRAAIESLRSADAAE